MSPIHGYNYLLCRELNEKRQELVKNNNLTFIIVVLTTNK